MLNKSIVVSEPSNTFVSFLANRSGMDTQVPRPIQHRLVKSKDLMQSIALQFQPKLRDALSKKGAKKDVASMLKEDTIKGLKWISRSEPIVDADEPVNKEAEWI